GQPEPERWDQPGDHRADPCHIGLGGHLHRRVRAAERPEVPLDQPLTDAFLGAASYHQRVLPAPWLLAVGLVLGLLVLLPARRLHLGGTSSQWIALYALCVWGLAFLLVVRPIAARFLLP